MTERGPSSVVEQARGTSVNPASRAICGSWETMITVVPCCRARSAKMPRTLRDWSGSSAAVGSSASTMAGPWARGAGDGHALAFAHGKAGGHLQQQSVYAQGRGHVPDRLQTASHAPQTAAGEQDVVAGRKEGQQAACLEHIAQMFAAQTGQGIETARPPQGQHVRLAIGGAQQEAGAVAAVGPQDAGQHVQGRTFAGSRWGPVRASSCP